MWHVPTDWSIFLVYNPKPNQAGGFKFNSEVLWINDIKGELKADLTKFEPSFFKDKMENSGVTK
jgi:hypothetical protein